MFKFFRKYNKYILAIGGSILMVLFLLPNLSKWTQPDPAKRTVGMIGDEKVRVRDTRQAKAEIQLLGAMGLPVRVSSNKTGPHWLMMLAEARRQGLYGSRTDAEQVLKAAGVTGDRITQIKKSFKTSDAAIYQALRHWIMVTRLQQLATNFRRLSEPQIRHTANDTQTRAKIRMVAMPADMLIDEIAPPQEKELQQRFNLNKADLPGNSKPYGFGYRLPDRVKLEYLQFSLAQIRKAIAITDVEANAYYLKHPDQFLPESEPKKNEDADDSSTESKADSKTASDDSAKTDSPSDADSNKPLPYAKVRDKAFKLATEAQATAQRDRMVKWTANLLREKEMRWRKNRLTNYYDIPPDQTTYDLEQVVKDVQKEFGVMPTVVKLADWLGLPDELKQLPGIGEAVLTFGMGQNQRSYSLSDYISATHQLNPPSTHPLLSLHLQVKVASRPMTNPAGDSFIFRLTAAEPTRPPKSLDEVRPQVLRDVKRLKAYGRLQDMADDCLKTARSEGLDALARRFGERYKTPLNVEKVDPFPRRYVDLYRTRTVQVPQIPGIGRSAKFVDAVFAQMGKVIAAGGVVQAGDECFTTIPLDAKLSLYVVQITGDEQLTEQEFESFKPFVGMVLRQLDAASLYASVNPFSFNALAQRVSYSEPKREQDSENKAPADEPVTQNTKIEK